MKCHDLETEEYPANAAAWAGFSEGQSSIISEATKVSDAVQSVLLASAQGLEAIQQTRVALARRSLERQIADQSPGLKTSFGLYRRYTDKAVANARAQVEGARELAVLARRALEARYVVDLSTSADKIFGVSAPAREWADSIYGLELDLPAAVGVNGGGVLPSGVYASTLLDYVNNLSLFASGYAITYPTTVTPPGPNPLLITIGPPQPPNTSAPITGSYEWIFYCPQTNTWAPLPTSGNVVDACSVGGPAPLRARVSFSLDPWGRVNNTISHPPVTNRYNERWVKFAVNLQGTGVHYCGPTASPDCTSNAVIPYNLSHYGPAWTSDFNESWRSLDLPIGFIEGGLAIATETDLTIFDWEAGRNNREVETVARTELADRPFGGTYWIELNPNSEPTLRLDLITGLQILVSEQYWTRQPH
jgi:hypothetical protein